MHRHLFEYAVIRVVPRVEREEFLNVGIVVYCAGLKFLKVKFELEERRLISLSSDLDLKNLREHLTAFTNICEGVSEGGPIATLDPASRFRWLTATRSTVIQTSKVHPGLCSDPDETLEKLYQQLVG